MPDPYQVYEYPPQGTPNGVGYYNLQSKVQVSSPVISLATTKTIIVGGQSNMATACGIGTYTTVNAASHNLNIYDGGIYEGSDPVFGASYAPTTGPSSVNMRIADRLITQGKATRVIMVPIAIGGTPFASWEPTTYRSLFSRIQTAIFRCRSHNIEPDVIIWGEGETDNNSGTSAASIKNSIWAIVDGIRALDCEAPFYVGKYTFNGVSNGTLVRTGIDNSIDATRDIRAGYDADTNCTVAAGCRLADNLHLSNTGLTTSANGWADLIYP